MRYVPLRLLACVALLLAGPAAAQPTTSAPASYVQPVQPGFAAHAMVAAANPHAVEAGLAVLRAGGNAVDAAVAVQAALGLVEPQSSGLGGGSFMLFYDAKTHRVTSYDGRETAPMSVKPDLWLGPDHQPIPFRQALVSGKGVGVPGAIAMLSLAQLEHGRLAWKDLFGGVERLARDGFIVTPRLAKDIAGKYPESSMPDAKTYFTRQDGSPYAVGDRLKNPAYADMLKTLAGKGAAAFYGVEVGQAIADKASLPPDPGGFTLSDLAAYKPKEGSALCRPYRAYVICAPPPPAGGVGVLEMMGELAHTDIASRGPDDPQAWYEFAEASRLALADVDHFVGDPAFTVAPVAGLLSPAYDASRAALIPTLGGQPVRHGDPPGALPEGVDTTVDHGGTSDFAVVDAEGNVVSMTTTVNFIFGSGRMTHGFFLNDELTDFAARPVDGDGLPDVNAPGPGKRPRSSMSPVIVLDPQGRFVGALGSPGGSSIIDYVAKSLVAWLDWKMPLEQAFALPNIVAKGQVVSVEKGEPQAIVQALEARGLQVKPDAGEESGLHGIVRTAGGYSGAADPRREGIARGY